MSNWNIDPNHIAEETLGVGDTVYLGGVAAIVTGSFIGWRSPNRLYVIRFADDTTQLVFCWQVTTTNGEVR